MSTDSLTITDNRTGKTYEIPIEHETIRALDLRQIKRQPDDFGLMIFDPAFTNTASAKSTITFIDGEKGILRYRGYPIEELAESSTFLEVAYLLVFGELPDSGQLSEWETAIHDHTYIHEKLKSHMQTFCHDAHPMAIFLSSIGALSTFNPDARAVEDPAVRLRHIRQIIAKVPTLAAFSYRHLRGLPYIYPNPDLSYTGNFLSMLFKMSEQTYQPNPILERALDVLFILHADHEQNCSTSTMRTIGSSLADPYSALSGAAAALYGPRHGGANEAVLRMLHEIGRVEDVPGYIKRVKGGEFRLMGFGHRVYKNFDPRANIIKRIAEEVFEVTGHNPLLDIALELERIALEDDYFVSRKLYPNVDFYSGIIYQALKLPVKFFPVLFALGRTAGWLSQWQEMLTDPELRIARPRQIYVGEEKRSYLSVDKR